MDTRTVPFLRVVADLNVDTLIKRFGAGASLTITRSCLWGTSVSAPDASGFYPNIQPYLSDLAADKWRLSNLLRELRGATTTRPYPRVGAWSVVPPCTYFDVVKGFHGELVLLQQEITKTAEKNEEDKNRERARRDKILAATMTPVDVVGQNARRTNWIPSTESSTWATKKTRR